MKRIHIIAALLSCAVTLAAQEALPNAPGDTSAQAGSVETSAALPKVGFFSYDAVLQAMPEYAAAKKSFDDLKSTFDKELVRAEQDFSKKFTEYLEGQKSFPQNIMLKRQKELQVLMDQSIQFRDEGKDILAKAEQDLMTPVHEKLRAAIEAVGKQGHYLCILNTDANACPYLGENADDCSGAIRAQLNIK